MKNKKLLLGFGVASAVVAPIATVVSIKINSKKNLSSSESLSDSKRNFEGNYYSPLNGAKNNAIQFLYELLYDVTQEKHFNIDQFTGVITSYKMALKRLQGITILKNVQTWSYNEENVNVVGSVAAAILKYRNMQKDSQKLDIRRDEDKLLREKELAINNLVRPMKRNGFFDMVNHVPVQQAVLSAKNAIYAATTLEGVASAKKEADDKIKAENKIYTDALAKAYWSYSDATGATAILNALADEKPHIINMIRNLKLIKKDPLDTSDLYDELSKNLYGVTNRDTGKIIVGGFLTDAETASDIDGVDLVGDVTLEFVEVANKFYATITQAKVDAVASLNIAKQDPRFPTVSYDEVAKAAEKAIAKIYALRTVEAIQQAAQDAKASIDDVSTKYLINVKRMEAINGLSPIKNREGSFATNDIKNAYNGAVSAINAASSISGITKASQKWQPKIEAANDEYRKSDDGMFALWTTEKTFDYYIDKTGLLKNICEVDSSGDIFYRTIKVPESLITDTLKTQIKALAKRRDEMERKISGLKSQSEKTKQITIFNQEIKRSNEAISQTKTGIDSSSDFYKNNKQIPMIYSDNYKYLMNKYPDLEQKISDFAGSTWEADIKIMKVIKNEQVKNKNWASHLGDAIIGLHELEEAKKEQDKSFLAKYFPIMKAFILDEIPELSLNTQTNSEGKDVLVYDVPSSDVLNKNIQWIKKSIANCLDFDDLIKKEKYLTSKGGLFEEIKLVSAKNSDIFELLTKNVDSLPSSIRNAIDFLSKDELIQKFADVDTLDDVRTLYNKLLTKRNRALVLAKSESSAIKIEPKENGFEEFQGCFKKAGTFSIQELKSSLPSWVIKQLTKYLHDTFLGSNSDGSKIIDDDSIEVTVADHTTWIVDPLNPPPSGYGDAAPGDWYHKEVHSFSISQLSLKYFS